MMRGGSEKSNGRQSRIPTLNQIHVLHFSKIQKTHPDSKKCIRFFLLHLSSTVLGGFGHMLLT